MRRRGSLIEDMIAHAKGPSFRFYMAAAALFLMAVLVTCSHPANRDESRTLSSLHPSHVKIITDIDEIKALTRRGQKKTVIAELRRRKIRHEIAHDGVAHLLHTRCF